MSNKRLLELVEDAFSERLGRKTNWGRNEVIYEYKAAVATAALQLLDEQQEKQK